LVFILLILFEKIGIDIVETVSDKEQDEWATINPEQVNKKILL
jgi:hypothetical protein